MMAGRADAAAPASPSPASHLRRQLGLLAVTALVIGEVIAVGIFLTPAGMAKALGSPFWLLVVWLAMGGMALCGALCYGELASRFPEAGGGYVYLREAYGPRVAFLYGWKCLLVMDPGVTAALAVGLASYVGYSFELSTLGLQAVAVGVVVALAAVNVVGVRIGAGLIGALTAIKLGALGLIVLLPILLGTGDPSNFVPFFAQRPGSEPLGPALAAGFVGAFFAFGGWWEVSKLAGEAREPARTVPGGLAIGVTVVTVAYILTSAAFLYLVPLERVGSGETFAAQAGEALFGPPGGQLFAGIVVVSVLGSLAVLLMALPRVYYAMARDGLFFRGVGKVHDRFGTPARAIALQAGLASLLIALGTFEEILGYFIFVTVIFLALTVAAVYVLRRREPDEREPDERGPDERGPGARRPGVGETDGRGSGVGGTEGRGSGAREADARETLRVFRTPGYPLTPAVFLALAAILLFLLASRNPLQALLGVAVVALGVPAYSLLFRKPGA